MQVKIIVLAIVLSIGHALNLDKTNASLKKYPCDYDEFDIDAALEDKSYLLEIIKCFSDKGPCDEPSAFFKSYMTEIVQQSCAKCTRAQKNIIAKFLRGAPPMFPKEMQQYQIQYDPDGRYFPALSAAVARSSR